MDKYYGGKATGFSPDERNVLGRTCDPLPEVTWFDRLLAEHAEMDERASKLRAFLITAEFLALDAFEQKCLMTQCEYMNGYVSVLGARIVHKRTRDRHASDEQAQLEETYGFKEVRTSARD